NAWRPDNQDTPIAEIRETRAGYVTNVDTRWVFDGSFLRGRNLLLGYTIPSDFVNRIKLSSARIYLSAQNFFLLTPYPFGDPEMTPIRGGDGDRKSTRLNSSHVKISYAVFCLKKKKIYRD